MRLENLNEESADFLFRDPSAPVNSSFSTASLPSSPKSVLRKDEKSFKAILLPVASIYSRQFCCLHTNSSAVTGFLVNKPSVNREGCESYYKQNDGLEGQDISRDGREERSDSVVQCHQLR